MPSQAIECLSGPLVNYKGGRLALLGLFGVVYELFQAALSCSGLFQPVLACYCMIKVLFAFFKRRLHRMFLLPNLLKMNFVLNFIVILGKCYYKVGKVNTCFRVSFNITARQTCTFRQKKFQ